MERKITFLLGATRYEARAAHVEPIEGLIVTVVSEVSYIENANFPSIWVSMKVFHYGKEVLENGGLGDDGFQFNPATDAEFYPLNYSMSVGGHMVQAGISGKLVSQKDRGWLPAFLHVKIEPA